MAALNLQLMNMYDSSVGSKRRDFLCYATDIFTLNWWNHLKTLYLKILIWYILTCEVLGFKTSKSQSTTKICQGDKWNPSSLRGMTLMTSHVTFIFNGRLRLKLTFTPPFSLEPSVKSWAAAPLQTHTLSPLYDWSKLSSAWQCFWKIWRSAWGKFGNNCEHF